MSIPPINLKTLLTLHHKAMRYDARYKMGAKVAFDTPVEKIKAVDCSGWIRYLVYNSTEPHLTIPDGSFNQREWAQQHLTRVPYKETIAAPNDLHIAFMNPEGAEAGHVFFVREGWTIESHGGRGPNQRRWDIPILLMNVDFTFLWHHIWV